MTRRFSFGPVQATLAAICVTGAIAIPFGDPRLIAVAIPTELGFIALTILTAYGFQKALYACLPLAAIVMIGNSLAPPHVQIMTTFSKPLNAVVLIIGGYVLQVLLIIYTVASIKKTRRLLKKEDSARSGSVR